MGFAPIYGHIPWIKEYSKWPGRQSSPHCQLKLFCNYVTTSVTFSRRKLANYKVSLPPLAMAAGYLSGKKAVGRPRVSKMKGRKVAPKYRNPKNRSETWAGRGAMPRWMAAQIKAGKKREDFAIHKSAAKARRAPVKKSRRKQK